MAEIKWSKLIALCKMLNESLIKNMKYREGYSALYFLNYNEFWT